MNETLEVGDSVVPILINGEIGIKQTHETELTNKYKLTNVKNI